MLRNKLRSKLKTLAESARKKKSRIIIARLLRTRAFREAEHIFTYVALPEEVDTKPMIRRAIHLGKKIYIPRVEPASHRLAVYRIRGLKSGVRRGAYGILEPSGKSMPVDLSRLDLLIVPGLGFDRKGRRLGRGKGYFDRFLKKVPKTVKIGLAFREQILPRIPAEAHDVTMDRVITD